MHILFMDESGTPAKPEAKGAQYFVVGGLIVPEGKWHTLRDGLLGLKIRHKVRGELKVALLRSVKHGRTQPDESFGPGCSQFDQG